MRDFATASIVIILGLAILWGLVLASPWEAASVCSGDVVDTLLCEGARSRATLFGSLISAAGMISAAILGAALIGRAGRTRNAATTDAATPSM